MRKGYELVASFTGVLTLTSGLVMMPQTGGNYSLQAHAQMTVTGTATSSTAANAFTTVAGEVTLPAGLLFNGNVTITPSFDGSNRVNALSLNLPPVIVAPAGSTFTRSAANVLTQIANGNADMIRNAEALSAIIRAGAGVDGLD